jgi:hypothetical protein
MVYLQSRFSSLCLVDAFRELHWKQCQVWSEVLKCYSWLLQQHHRWAPSMNCKEFKRSLGILQQTGIIKFIIKNLPPGKVEPTMSWFLRPQSSGTRIRLVPNSSASTGGKLWDTNPSRGQCRLPHPQWIHFSPWVRLQLSRRCDSSHCLG